MPDDQKGITVTASDFARNFGRWQDRAHAEGMVRVTSHGRVVGAYLSEEELAHFEKLKLRDRQVIRVEDLPDDMLAAIAAAEYGKGPA